MKTENSEHLQWLHNRFVNQHNESPNVDFLIRLREIIEEEAEQEKRFREFKKFLEERKTEKTRVIEEMKNKKVEVPERKKKVWKPPFRVGRKQNRAVLDSNGVELVVFPFGAEKLAEQYCKLINKYGIS